MSNKKKHNTRVLKKKVYHITKINKINFDKIIFCGLLYRRTIKTSKNNITLKKTNF